MAGQGVSSSSDKKSKEVINDVSTYRAENLQNNMKVVYYRYVCVHIEWRYVERQYLRWALWFHLQPNIFVDNLRGYCWDFRVDRLYGVYILFHCHGNYFNWTNSKGKVLPSFLFWLLESYYTRRILGWAYGKPFSSMFWLALCFPYLQWI